MPSPAVAEVAAIDQRTEAEKVPILRYLRPYRRSLVIGAVLLVITNVLDKAVPYFLQQSIDSLSAGATGSLRFFALMAMLTAGLMWVFRTSSRIWVFNVGRSVEYDLRNELLAHLQKLDEGFYRGLSTGEIMSRATNDLNQVRLLLGFGILNLVNTLLAYGLGIALMINISPELTLWAMIPFPLFVLFARGFGKALYQRSRRSQEALGRLAEVTQESLSAVRLVRAFGLERRESIRFGEANSELVDRNMKLVVLRGFMWPLLMGISALGTVIVIWRGGTMVLEGQLTVGEFAAFHAYLGQLVWPTLAFGWLLSVLQRGRASYDRVRRVLDTVPSIDDPSKPDAVPQGGALRVSGLHYDYGKGRGIRDISFDVPAGGSLAIVGRTGSGKTTVARLLPRLLDTPTGCVFLDEVDITRVRRRELRQAIGLAQQSAFLFSSTVSQNIAFPLREGTDEERLEWVEGAAKEAAVLDEIHRLPGGMNTVVGERGVQLSGGQKQRVALARSLLNQPRVLILDDPMSAVDAETERKVLDAIERVGRDRTLILITHRVAAASQCDNILVLDEGRIVQRGAHDELVAQEGLYATLASRQQLEAELEAI
jgi:ATP-binding cassette subfamily B protein